MRMRILAPLAFLLTISTGALARGGMPEALSPQGKVIEDIYYQIFLAGVLVFIFVFALLAYVVIRFRNGSGHGRATFEAERESLRLELLWILIPLAIVMWVGWISFVGLNELDAIEGDLDDSYVIDVIGSQYNWRAEYPEGFAVSASPGSLGEVADGNVFVVPADEKIVFRLTSVDVIHAFYIQDANGGPVGMRDANPTGPHKYNPLPVELPVGEYRVQCAEMCLNPGHGYMRARIEAVPAAEYGSWTEQKILEAGASVLQEIDLQASGGTLTGADGLTLVQGTRLIVTAHNNEATAVDFSVQNHTVHTTAGEVVAVTVPPGGSTRFAVSLEEPGDVVLMASNGGEATVTVLQATVVEWVLDEWSIAPPDLTLTAGETYLFQVANAGVTDHNLYVGTIGGEAPWFSDTIPGGAETSFVVTPTETVTMDTWCNIPGHAQAGMQGSITFS